MKSMINIFYLVKVECSCKVGFGKTVTWWICVSGCTSGVVLLLCKSPESNSKSSGTVKMLAFCSQRMVPFTQGSLT